MRQLALLVLCLALLTFSVRDVRAQTGKQRSGRPSLAQADTTEAAPRIGLSAGMGVSYMNPQDLADYISGRSLDRVPDFKTAVEFFGNASFPLSNDWIAKLDYTYLFTSYNTQTVFAPTEYFVSVHMPSLIFQYALATDTRYNVRAGLGLGYHFGRVEESQPGISYVVDGSGMGMLADLEANTAFGDDFFGYLGATLRWEFIGDLTNAAGTTGIVTPALNFFSVGARFGVTFYL